jgi:TRAP-type C4-dicarboxylate transport system permease small subunit
MRLFAVFVTFLAWAAALMFVLAGVMLTYEVVARYFFTAPTIWAAELSQLCLIWGTLIAMPWCLRERRHIQITAVTALLSPGGRRLASAAAMVAVAVFSLVVLWKGGEIFWDSFERGRTTGSLLNLPTWIAELSIPASFALLLAQSLIETRRAFRDELPKQEAPLE